MDAPLLEMLPVEDFTEHYAALQLPGVAHSLVRRIPEVAISTDKGAVLAALQPWHHQAAAELGFAPEQLFTAEQIHGAELALLTRDSPRWSPGVDGLLTNQPGLLLGIHTADCAPVFLVDPVRKAIALLHSGRKSTEAGITQRAIAAMQQNFSTDPRDLILQIGPCIRPPHFEMDLTERILRDAAQAGIPDSGLYDCSVCTGSRPDLYYSYRVEKGCTGRMLALLGLHR